MPYKNIVWIKLKLELLDDRRFQDLCNERQQLLYLKLLMLAGRLENNIPNDPNYIKREVNYRRYPSELTKDLRHLSSIFPKLIVGAKSIEFINFNELHNFRKPQTDKKDSPREDKEKIREDKKKIRAEVKGLYGEFKNVKLTDSEKNKLIEKFGKEEASFWLEKVDEYVEQSGKKYNSHYLTILNFQKRSPEEYKNNKNQDYR